MIERVAYKRDKAPVSPEGGEDTDDDERDTGEVAERADREEFPSERTGREVVADALEPVGGRTRDEEGGAGNEERCGGGFEPGGERRERDGYRQAEMDSALDDRREVCGEEMVGYFGRAHSDPRDRDSEDEAVAEADGAVDEQNSLCRGGGFEAHGAERVRRSS